MIKNLSLFENYLMFIKTLRLNFFIYSIKMLGVSKELL
jgi:hypothetical protein